MGGPQSDLGSSPVVYTFPAPYSPIRGQLALDYVLAEALFRGQLFVNIHSTAFSTGELRGTLAAEQPPSLRENVRCVFCVCCVSVR